MYLRTTPYICTTYLETKNKGPQEPEYKLRIPIHDLVIPDVDQLDLLDLNEVVQSILYVL